MSGRIRTKPAPIVAIEPIMVNISGVCAITGLSESAIRRAVKAGAFPPPERLLGCVLWRVANVKAWAAA
ncbi:MAG: AlpA family phage regulatory protein [Pseudomonadota bacterium]|nr:AlpA family phage regulatory protein [Pseudomonadota bacterium]